MSFVLIKRDPEGGKKRMSLPCSHLAFFQSPQPRVPPPRLGLKY